MVGVKELKRRKLDDLYKSLSTDLSIKPPNLTHKPKSKNTQEDFIQLRLNILT